MTKFAIIRNQQTPAVPSMSVEELLQKKDLLLDFLKHASTSYKNGIGLAANQVGITDEMGAGAEDNRFMLPVFAKMDLDTEEWHLVLNPKVIGYIGEVSEKIEYCLTWPGKIITVDRHYGVIVEWYDIRGKRRETKATGFHAQLWQHEINHLHGIEEKVSTGSGGMQVSEEPGRNDPCPCGSGKKYKKCCLNN